MPVSQVMFAVAVSPAATSTGTGEQRGKTPGTITA
jgi:hypothetical protein